MVRLQPMLSWQRTTSTTAFVIMMCICISTIQAFTLSSTFLPGLRACRCKCSKVATTRMSATDGADIVIVGSGPTGLAAAIMLAQRGYNQVKVYDRLPQPADVDSASWGDGRSYNVGLSGRGQKALRDLTIMSDVDAWCANVNGRMDWTPGATQPRVTMLSGMKGYTTKVIQRDRLASCLLKVLKDRYSDCVDVVFDTKCTSVKWGPDKVELTLENGGGPKEMSCRAVIGADGVGSCVRDAMRESDEAVQVKRYDDDNKRVYKPLRLELPDTIKSKDLSFSVRTDTELILEALPTKEGQLIGVLLFREDDERVQQATTERAARKLFEEHMPMVVDYVIPGGFGYFASEKTARLPTFQYCGPVVNRGGQAVLLGDAIHCVKPYFGLGVNSAFEDVTILGDCLARSGDDLSEAFDLFSKERGGEAMVLVQEQQVCLNDAARIKLRWEQQSLLHHYGCKNFPKLFKPPIQNMMQQPGYKFTEIRTLKRLDRAGQIALVGGGGMLAVRLTTGLFDALQAVLTSTG